jgi:aryl-alcohol dehydrogenase-like predicted oxidoreductase
MQKRTLGRTGEALSVVGFGGVLVMDETPATADTLVGQAIDRGITYFDVAPQYGNAEERLGPALEPYRSGVFLACKSLERTRDACAAELRESLRKLRTDHFDLHQFHAVTTLDDVDRITGRGGALEAVTEAQAQGLVRYIGFSAHGEDAALALLERFTFDSVLFPFNWACWQQGGFGARLLQEAQRRGTGLLGLKALCRRKLQEGEARQRPKCWYAPVENCEEARAALGFALSLPITAAVAPGEPELFHWMCEAAERLESAAPSTAALPVLEPTFEPLFHAD